jgi:hypothetical protein
MFKRSWKDTDSFTSKPNEKIEAHIRPQSKESYQDLQFYRVDAGHRISIEGIAEPK